MAAFPIHVRGLNVGLVVFSLLVMGGAAAVMSNPQVFKTGASNVIESATGKLVKKGTPAFSPCANATTTYGLIGAQPTTPVNAKTSPTPTPACTPLSVTASLADPLVGLRVIATGTFTNGIFYATNLTLVGSPIPSPKPKPSLPPQANPRAY